ncbi:MAG: exo-beta-N-acetylmuramidase NamZ family protein [Bacteroidales bacterium]
MLHKKIILLLFLYSVITASAQEFKIITKPKKNVEIQTAAQQTERYIPLLQNKQIAIVANPTSMIGKTHLVDSLLSLGLHIKKVFSPEHGFRGDQEAGERVQNRIDDKTKLPLISLYGENKKPKPSDLQGIDIVVFDIQDVGARFYTYISTLHYVMEACAENNIEIMVLDRPNPNAYYVDGPVLDIKYSSFVGMHPVPIVYGMTIAEYAKMINGEKWLKNGIQCKLQTITVNNYNHTDFYSLPEKPSPNLMTMSSIYLYPSLCLFEGTVVSVGRGTMNAFEVLGHPKLDSTNFSFTPQAIKGMSAEPPFKNQRCFGYDLSDYSIDILKNEKKLNLFWLIDLYHRLSDKGEFFTPFFDKLAGSDALRKQIISGKTEDEIRQSWQADLLKFKEIRKKYLLYTDFE